MLHSFAVVGPGRLGQSLVRALVRAGFNVAATVTRSEQAGPDLERSLGVPSVALSAVPDLADIIFLTVPDACIDSMAAALQVSNKHLLVHCSGACELHVLAAAARRGAATACFHPLQAFPDGHGDGRFMGARIGIEAAPSDFERLSQIARALQAVPISLAGVDRASYHAAAVFASNYLVAVEAAATEAWCLAGLPIEEAWPALQTLAAGALSAITGRSLAEGLTGPVTRGDVQTVRRHMHALSQSPELADLYKRLGAQLVRLGRPLDGEKRIELERLFAPQPRDPSKNAPGA